MSLQLPPPLSQRRHRYANVSGGVPDHAPLSAVNVCSSCAVPPIVGNAVLTGAAPATTAVAAEVALLEPAVLLAVTATRRVRPTSALVSAYVVLVAPAMSVHPLPALSQRRH